MRLKDREGYTITDGHDLARELLRKHSVDRYPTIEQKLLKLVTEVGELVDAHMKPDKDVNDFAKEYADVGLTLYHIGNAMYLNLEEEMLKVVSNETRKFA
jgi:NTP pyrophosphatase (non-canonical NTP hydrolase)